MDMEEHEKKFEKEINEKSEILFASVSNDPLVQSQLKKH